MSNLNTSTAPTVKRMARRIAGAAHRCDSAELLKRTEDLHRVVGVLVGSQSHEGWKIVDKNSRLAVRLMGKRLQFADELSARHVARLLEETGKMEEQGIAEWAVVTVTGIEGREKD